MGGELSDLVTVHRYLYEQKLPYRRLFNLAAKV